MLVLMILNLNDEQSMSVEFSIISLVVKTQQQQQQIICSVQCERNCMFLFIKEMESMATARPTTVA